MGGLLYLGKVDPKNISLGLPQTLPDLHGWTHTHKHTNTPYHCGSAVLCCGRLKWPLWAELNISVHSGRASEWLLPPAASAPGTGCQPACRPTSLNPCQAPDAILGGPASCGSGRALLKCPPPPPPPPPTPLLWLPQQPQTTSLCSQCGAPQRISQCCKLYFYHTGRMWMYCIFEGFWRSEK